MSSGPGGLAGKDRMCLDEGIAEIRPGIFAYGDLWHWAFWNPGMKAGQFSSRDPGNLNIDLLHFHGRHQGARVMARVPAFSVIHRVWSAGPTGRLEFYRGEDGDPFLVCPFAEYLEGGGCGSWPEFAVGRFSNYTPLLFTEPSVVASRGMDLAESYYQVSYMSFADRAPLEALLAMTEDEQLAARRAAVDFFGSMGKKPGRDPGGLPLSISSERAIGSGESHTVSVDGAGMVTELRLFDPEDPAARLEGVRLRLFWDGGRDSAVDAPADALFGNLLGARGRKDRRVPRSLVFSADDHGYSLRAPMPFLSGMVARIDNCGPVERKIRLEIDYRAVDSLPENAMRFHAEFRRRDYERDLRRPNLGGLWHEVDQSQNYLVLDRRGAGNYVGEILYVLAEGPDWWGEGDLIIAVDGERAVLGTGTEDEYNWSYGLKEYRSPVSGVLQAERPGRDLPTDSVGANAMYRFRPGDFVPFAESIEVGFERLGSVTEIETRYPGAYVNVTGHRGDDYASVAFWYELPAAFSDPVPP